MTMSRKLPTAATKSKTIKHQKAVSFQRQQSESSVVNTMSNTIRDDNNHKNDSSNDNNDKRSSSNSTGSGDLHHGTSSSSLPAQAVVRGRQRSRIQPPSTLSPSHSSLLSADITSATTFQHKLQRSISVDDIAARNQQRRTRIENNLIKPIGDPIQRSSSEDGAGGRVGTGSLTATTALLQQLRASLDDVAATRIRRRASRDYLAKLGTGQILRSLSKDRGKEKDPSSSRQQRFSISDDSVDRRQQRWTGKKDLSKLRSPPRSRDGRGRTSATTSSATSLSTAESECDSLISVLRSYPLGERGGGERKKGQLDVMHRRRGSSLSRNAARVLGTLDDTSHSAKDTGESGGGGGGGGIDDDSKASMVYDIPFDPITGKCHHHSTVQMAVRDEDEKKLTNATSSGDDGRSIHTDAAVIFGWRIIRTTCPKCKYNY